MRSTYGKEKDLRKLLKEQALDKVEVESPRVGESVYGESVFRVCYVLGYAAPPPRYVFRNICFSKKLVRTSTELCYRYLASVQDTLHEVGVNFARMV